MTRRHLIAKMLVAVLVTIGFQAFGQTSSKKGPDANNPSASDLATRAPVANSQDSGPPPNADPAASVDAVAHSSDLWRYMTSYEFALAVLVLMFGAAVVVSASVSLKGKNVTPEQTLRFYGVIVILIGTILLIVAGLTNDQIAPAVGLFGTLAGYLLGRNQASDNGSEAVPQPSKEKDSGTS